MKRSQFKRTYHLIRAGAFSALFIIPTASAQDLEETEPEILRVRVEQGNLREIVIEEAAPVFRKKVEKAKNPIKEQVSRKSGAKGKGRIEAPVGKQDISYVLVATVFEGGVTKLSWNSTSGDSDGKFEAWSAYDWSSMYGFQSVENNKSSYTYLLFVRNASDEDQRAFGREAEKLRERDSASRKGSLPFYQLQNQRELTSTRRKEATDFLQTVHSFIGTNRKRIRLTNEARDQAREENRLREIADRGKMKPPVTIRFSRVYRQEENADQGEGGVK